MSELRRQSAEATFRHGVHPPDHKESTHSRAIERVPFVAEYVLHLAQHIGAPSVPVVEAGQSVRRGQLVATADGFVSTALHAPVTGRVKGIEPRLHANGKMLTAIVLEADPYSSQAVAPSEVAPVESMAPGHFVQSVQDAGLVGLGGAAFPSHVKLSVPDGKRVRFFILNGCECEPYLTCDDRIMVERPRTVLRGALLMMQHLDARHGYVGIEANKPEAAALMRSLMPPSLELVELEVKYPQGAEKMLIEAILKQEVPSGGLPLDLQILVNNVGTAAALAEWFDDGIPLIERVVTVAGPGIRKPRNVIVPLGTPVQTVLDFCGGLRSETRQVILGGPMMGMAQKTLDVPVVKGTSGVLAFTALPSPSDAEYPCIRCGRCLEACAVFLNPTRLAQLARAEQVGALKDLHVLDCFECASCSYVCPSNIPLVQWIRMGKAMVREAQQA